MNKIIKKFDHIVITTGDLEKCLEFYQAVGFQIKKGEGRYELFAGDIKINVHVLGEELSPKASNVQLGSGDFCLEIKGKIEEFRDELEEKGLKIKLGVVGRTGVKGRMSSIYLKDPDGNLVEFCSYE